MEDFLRELFAPYKDVIYKALGLYVISISAVALDLIAGIRKSRKNGLKKIHSYGLRQTVNKLARYFNLLLAAGTIDAAIIIADIHEAHGLPMIPYFTFFMTLILCIIEGYSIWEKDDHKGKYIEAAKIASEAVKSVDLNQFADSVVKKLEEKENENKINNSLNNSIDIISSDKLPTVQKDKQIRRRSRKAN